jgi:hypothetical protein
MRAIKWVAATLALVCWPATGHSAAYVLGDSHGEAMAKIVHVKGLAKISVHIRGPKALAQMAQVPPGSTVFLVLGTNDANGSIARLDKSIDDIVRAAENKNISLVWIGPPCVRKSWDTRARELDGILREKLSLTSVRYVSMRDDELCSGALHERDGVHLKTKGYAYMWERAQAASGIAVASADSAQDLTGSLRATAPKKLAHVPLPLPRRPIAGVVN